MTYAPNANWTTAVDASQQQPVYFIKITDKTDEDYSTHPVKAAGTTKTVLMNEPSGGSLSVDIIAGTRTSQRVEVELLDVSGEITDLIATEAAAAPLAALINRQVTVYGGYRSLDESDYPAIFTGRITGVQMNGDLTGYVLTLTDLSHMLDADIMLNATTDKPATIRGNVVNVYWALLTGTFSTTHSTFPLASVSADAEPSEEGAEDGTSVPTGIGIDAALINTAQLVSERDIWHPTDIVEVKFDDIENAKSHLSDELFRVFQCFPTISGDGLLGLKFHVPALPAAAAPVIDTDHIVGVQSWERLYEDHLNKFTYMGDYDIQLDTYASLNVPETTEDTDDQTATLETIEYLVESRWLHTEYDGVSIASELAGRQRIRYLKTPAVVDILVNFRKRNIEQGDVVALSHPQLPDLFTGSRGVSARLMSVISIAPDFRRGLLKMRLLDTGYKRYGVIAPEAQAAFDTATDQEKNTFFFISNASGAMSDGSDGYRLI